MGLKERREREKKELAGKIMDAARAIFVAEGYDKVSMRRIAEVIEYSPAAIYAYFPDKESLFRAICTEDFSRLAKAFNELSQIKKPLERLKETGKAYIRFAVRHPQHYRLMFMTPHPREIKPTQEMIEQKSDPGANSYAFMKQAVREVRDAGLFRPELKDVELIAQVLWASVHGVASCQITFADDPCVQFEPLEKRTELMLDAVLRGLLRCDGPKRGRQ